MKKTLQKSMRLAMIMVMLLGATLSYGQGKGKPEKKPLPAAALEHIKKNKQKLELEDADIAELEVSSVSDSKKKGLKHYYVKQLHQGIEISGAISTISLDQNENVVAVGKGFKKGLAKQAMRAKTMQSPMSAEQAVAAAAGYLKTPLRGSLTVIERGEGDNKEVLFSNGGISLESIPAKLVYQPMEDGSLRLAWEVSIYELDAQNWWNIRMDANTGEVLDKDNMVVHCQFENDGPGGKFMHDEHSHALMSPYVAAPAAKAASGYNVFPMPIESPSHGPREFVSTSVADQVASPNGWHYLPVAPGLDTRTRGNNVFAYEDPNNNNNYTTNYSPDGGPELNFDFPIDFNQAPVTYRDAAITNLFYWNNIIHDVWYQYGFDEESGNFQYDNFGRGGAQSDPVLAEAQDNRNGTSRNNANFATGADGFAPRMQMYLWSSPPDADMFRVTAPGDIAGSYPAIQAAFGPRLNSTPLTGRLVLYNDGSAIPAEGCAPATNAAAIAGNIAVVYRGTCSFVNKVQFAQAAGAIAVIVINNAPGAPIIMGGDPTEPINIPSVMVSDVTGAAIRARLDANQEVTVTLKDDGRPELDGDFDNGIIVHEYGHGISNRLTGGRLVANCLNNAEQMGEGWSDWFGLMMTMRPGDTGPKKRGIGTYAQGQATDGNGIRPAPYSTDFGINPHTYESTNNAAISQPHGIGFVWSTMLWDMTWALIDKYGFDEDIYHGTGGNNMAMQLVIDGLKMQPCRPGFVDGRDAILLADQLNNSGANQELIWRAFAKRGLGYSASQGLNTNRFDQVEAFDLPPVYACDAPTITVQKSSNVYTGGDANTIFLGYGAQSVMLQANGDLSFSYTWSPADGLSDPNIANPVFTPTEAGTYTFTVTAVNDNGCTRTASVTINVIEVRETPGNSRNTKVIICHNGKATVVAHAAVAAHLQHGDNLGDCGMAVTSTAAITGETVSAERMSLRAVPNPFGAKTDIGFTLTQDGSYKLEVLDMRGAVVAVLAQSTGRAGEHKTYQFEKGKLAGGMYIARLVTDEGVSFIRIVMQK
ncbi:T9SS-dependent M36 family metallopeptidase [uncultured Pontibacter sp.]|uniref:T9SS-dependent M36 family metallopeptidase n=1 Tax=uncultured Pontibacter sp. TaxID=453356 RepID=UPI002611B72D|nr:T9SS-dependent M36 family metallopeptidase [uncultured Pontibacter sp.]